MIRAQHQLKATAAALMLLVAQIFGLPLGFGCDCSGNFNLVSAPTCETAACHADEPHHHEHDGAPCETPGHDHEHSLITADLSATQTRADNLPQMVPMIVIPAWEDTGLSMIERRHLSAAEAPRERQQAAPPSSSVWVKRSVVLLV